MATSFRTGALSCALLATTCLVAPAAAQSTVDQPVPPTDYNLDSNGVDLVSGKYYLSSADLSIGRGASGLVYRRTARNLGSDDNYQTALRFGTDIRVSIGARTDRFASAGGTSLEGTGATLTTDAATGDHLYTARDGTVFRFSAAYASGRYRVADKRVTTITRPDGRIETLAYDIEPVRFCKPTTGECYQYAYEVTRVTTVTSSAGYRLMFRYALSKVLPGSELRTDEEEQVVDWMTVESVTASNDAVGPCSQSSCPDEGTLWPKVSYSWNGSSGVQQITDPLGRTRSISYSGGRVTGIRPAGSAANRVTIGYDTAGRVASFAVAGSGIWTYAYLDDGSERTTTVTDPLGHQRVVVSDLVSGKVESVEDESDNLTEYEHDTLGRLTKVTHPEGNSAIYGYDGRSNLISTTLRDKAGNSANNIVTTAAYPSACANPKTCNQPTSTTDAAGHVTDYSYDSTHGQVTSVTLPAAPNGIRPQTRFSYSAVNGVHLLSSISACQTISGASAQAPASCAGTADEVKTVIAYNAALLPTAVTSGDGTGALAATRAMTWDAIGNLQTIDGPLAGAADTTRYRFNLGRELVGVIGPDPDGAGPLEHRAQRIQYDAAGQVGTVERGTVSSQSDADWAAFASLEAITSSYDANGRKVKDALVVGGATHAVTEYAYDALGRVHCTAVRMNPAAFGLLRDGCTLGTEGSFGPDRITRTSYDAAGQLVEVREALWTADEANVAVYLYTANGKVAHAIDGEGNATGYGYDDHDRLNRIVYPSPTVPGNTNPADDELLTYDARGNIVSRQLRDDQTITYGYDNLSRLVSKDVPATAYPDFDLAYAYDNLGRPLTVSDESTRTARFAWDALGRVVSEKGQFGFRYMAYDPAGRMTRLTWPDGFFVTYEHNTAGDPTAIRENGSALLASFAYDDLGRRTSLTRGNGTVTSYAYDPVSRLASLADDFAGTADDHSVTFAYNPASQIVSRTGSNNAYAWTGHFNQNVTDTMNGLNQILTTGSETVQHDLRGNVSAIGATSYVYTTENRLRTAGGVNMVYDPLGRLLTVGDASATTKFDILGAMLIAEYDGADAMTRRYVHGPSTGSGGVDEPLVAYSGPGLATKHWLHADERGSIYAISRADGSLGHLNRYDDYGKPQGTLAGRFGYTGQAWIPELQLYYYKARMYHPGLGRFMQTDPSRYADGLNMYVYTRGDPVNFIDPTGLKAQEPGGGGTTCGIIEGPLDNCVIEVGHGGGGGWSGYNDLWRGWIGDWLGGSDGRPADDGLGFNYIPGLAPPIPLPELTNFTCPSGPRATFSDAYGLTIFLFDRGVTLNAEVGLATPLGGGLRGSQAYGSVNIVGLGGRGLFGGAGESLSVGYLRGPIDSGYTNTRVVQGGAAFGAGGEGSYTYSDGSSGSISGGPRAGFGAYLAAGDKHSYTAATPQVGCAQ